MELNFLQAYLITIAMETAVLFFLMRSRYPALVIARNAIIASSLTLPFVWFVFPLLFGDYALRITVSELFAFAAEAGVYLALFKGIKIRDAIVVSFVCNAASFAAGILIQA